MKQETIKLGSQTIAYYQNEAPTDPAGPPILFIHGNSASGRTFNPQFDSSLSNHYRLISLDLPGHGDSDPQANQADYGMPGYAAVIAELAQALEATNAVLVGWSLGGHIALELHNHLPDAAGFVIFGTPPLAFPPAMEQAFLPNPAMNVGMTAEITQADAIAYAKSFFAPSAKAYLQPFVNDILRTKGQARAGLAASIKPDGYQDEVEIVAHLKRPLAILHGEEEQLVSLEYIKGLNMPTLWRDAVQVIPGAGHAPHHEQTKMFNRLLSEFMTSLPDNSGAK